MRYIYGPVKSRRLGLSLGVSLTPRKTCNYDCLYCQLGHAEQKVSGRGEYIKAAEVLAELKLWLQNNSLEAKGLDYITLSGSGEPTLNIRIGQIIQEIKKVTNTPVAVITNGSLLNDPSVRRELSVADLIVPSLDAATTELFQKIDRPEPNIKVEDIIGGLINLRKEFRGKIWLEVMLVKGINDDLSHIEKLKAVIDQVRPEKIQINSPVRSSSEINISSVGSGKLEKIKGILGDRCEIV